MIRLLARRTDLVDGILRVALRKITKWELTPAR